MNHPNNKEKSQKVSTKLTKYKSSFSHASRFSKLNLTIFALVFVCIGSYFLFFSHAACITGDVNCDGVVNATDLSLLLSNYNTNYAAAEWDGTTVVEAHDLSILLANWGKTSTPAPTVTLSANPTSISSGSSSTLTWSSTNATSCAAASPGGWTSSTATSGSQSVSPTTTTSYTITCTGAGGSTTSSPSSVTVTGGSGQTTNCFNANSDGTDPKPSVCGLPDPNSAWTATTGVGPNNGSAAVACSALATQHTGDVSTSSSLSNENITGSLTVTGNNITINNVCVTDPNNGQTSQAVNISGSNVTISNSTIQGSAAGSKVGVQDAVWGSANLSHDLIQHCNQCISYMNGVTVSYTYVMQDSDESGNGTYSCDENEDFYEADDTLTIDHSVLLNPIMSCPTAVLFGDTGGGSGGPCDNHFTVTYSLLGGENYVSEPCANASGAGTNSISFTHDNFVTCSSNAGSSCSANSHGYAQNSGDSGLMVHCYNTGMTWSNNVWDYGGGAISESSLPCN